MNIYTKTGDKRETSIIGGKRVSKADPRLEAYGTLDELVAFEGELYNRCSADKEVQNYLIWIINRTMDCSSLVASDGTTAKKLPQITEDTIKKVENMIDTLLTDVPPITHFTLPIGSNALSASHICRTICRRAERSIVKLPDSSPEVLSFVNRLSDFFYALGRHIVYFEKAEEIYWTPEK